MEKYTGNRTQDACLTHKRSAIELQRLCIKQTVLGLIPSDGQTFVGSVLFKKKPVKEREHI